MKKAKLLNVGLCATLLPATIIPMVSCQNSKGITEQQWKNAFLPLYDLRNTTRNFTVEGTITNFIDFPDFKRPITAKCVGANMEGTDQTEPAEQGQAPKIDHYYTMMKDEVIWCCDGNSTAPTPMFAPYGHSGMTLLFYSLGSAFADLYNVATKTGDHKYQAIILNLGYIKAVIDVELNTSFQLTKLDLDVYYQASATHKQSLYAATLTFKDWGTTTYSAESKFKFDGKIFEAKQQDQKFTSTITNSDDFIIKFDMPDTLAIANLNTLTPSQPFYADSYSIVLNNNELVIEDDYTAEINKDNNVTKITLKKALAKGDKLRFISNDTWQNKTLDLAAGK